MNDDLKDSILTIFEASFDAQLRAVRRLRQGDPSPARPTRSKGLSQVDMAFDVLRKARSTPPFASPSIAKASSLPSLKRSPARTVSCAPGRIPSPSVRRPDDATGGFLGNRRRLARRVS